MRLEKDNSLYSKAEKCLENLSMAIHIFENILSLPLVSSSADYYRARNFLKDGEASYEETLLEAHRFLGPLPAYSTPDFGRWREEFLNKYMILADNKEMEALRTEINQDDLLKKWLSSEEIDILLGMHYEEQQKGKRRLPHIKIRMLVDKLRALLELARELNKKARERIQSPGA